LATHKESLLTDGQVYLIRQPIFESRRQRTSGPNLKGSHANDTDLIGRATIPIEAADQRSTTENRETKSNYKWAKRAKGKRQATNKFSWVSSRIRIGGETTTKLLMHNELEARPARRAANQKIWPVKS